MSSTSIDTPHRTHEIEDLDIEPVHGEAPHGMPTSEDKEENDNGDVPMVHPQRILPVGKSRTIKRKNNREKREASSLSTYGYDRVYDRPIVSSRP
ncbi:hypothetical protein MMC15_004587 [Xylographa vitiligo]|nr:hypothetical protein [Xylographa vitiligo]